MSGGDGGGGETDPLGGRFCCSFLFVLLFLPLNDCSRDRKMLTLSIGRCVGLCCRRQVILRSFSCSFTTINSSHTVISVCSLFVLVIVGHASLSVRSAVGKEGKRRV